MAGVSSLLSCLSSGYHRLGGIYITGICFSWSGGWKSKIKSPADLLSGGGDFFLALRWLSSHCVFISVLFYKGTNLIHEGCTLMI